MRQIATGWHVRLECSCQSHPGLRRRGPERARRCSGHHRRQADFQKFFRRHDRHPGQSNSIYNRRRRYPHAGRHITLSTRTGHLQSSNAFARRPWRASASNVVIPIHLEYTYRTLPPFSPRSLNAGPARPSLHHSVRLYARPQGGSTFRAARRLCHCA
jgi:hypothetical protein